jgi:fibronectin-binding autotransporter adhesin
VTPRSWIRNVFSRTITHPIRKGLTRTHLSVHGLEDRTVPSTFTVNSIADSGAGSGLVGDLRYCITQANANGGADAINFDSALFSTPQTITLGGTELEFTDTTGATSITGPVGGVTVSGGGVSRVFEVDALVTSSISGMTITGGNAGYYAYYGGGVFNHGTATLTNCTVSGNSALFGGGGLATGSYSNQGGATTLNNCTISGNFGGGVSTYYGTTAATNTIIAGNDFDLSGPLDPASTNNLVGVNPLLAPLGNYGGTGQTMPLLPGSPAIDAGTSTGAPAADERGSSRFGAVDIGAFESQGFNYALVASSTPQTANIGTAFAKPLAVSVTANNPIEPVDGGGGVSFVANKAANGATAILSTSSPVIAGGLAAVTAVPNNVLGKYTVAVTFPGSSALVNLTNAGKVFTSLVVNTTSDSLSPGAGFLSLREAIAFNNYSPTGNAPITFDSGKGHVFNTPQTITLTGSQLELSNTSKTATITGPTARVTVNGGGLSRVFQIDTLVASSISGLTISGGNAGIYGSGGGVLSNGTLTLTNCSISGNSGGGMANDGTATLTSCTISGNTAGSGVFNNGTVTMTNCAISGNSASGYFTGSSGGGVANYGTATLTNCTVSSNFASGGSFGGGGGIVTGAAFGSGAMAKTTMTNCTVSNNRSGSAGGGLLNFGTTTLTNCSVAGNTAAGVGGGLRGGAPFFADPGVVGTMTLNNCTISGNSAGTGGGVATGGAAIAFYGAGYATTHNGVTVLSNCTVSNNSATFNGGGLITFGLGTTTATNSKITGNTAGRDGGGAYSSGFVFYGTFQGTTNLTNCTVSGNSAARNGGGLANAKLGSTTVAGGNIKNNTAVAGGGIFNLGTLSVASCNVSFNSATSKGGGISTTGGSATISNSLINNNSVTSTGAALGGGINCENSVLSVTGCAVNFNQAKAGNGAAATGGGIDVALGSTATISNSTFWGNNAQGGSGGTGANGGDANGGGIAVTDTSSLSFSGGSLILNTAQGGAGGSGANGGNGLGGGIYVGTGATATIGAHATVSGNVAQGGNGLSGGDGLGGGIYVGSGANVGVTNSAILLNLALGGNVGGHGIGGGVYNLGTFTSDPATLFLLNFASTSNNNIGP